ncbi:MAG: hypothetical protein PHP14_02875 [Candidatus Pacebacteria bacterium]|nr:hypothetical protein [Candidatus Paceibacterota bacterium]
MIITQEIKMENIKLNDVIVCDDIRSEIGGKHTIVGLVNELNAKVSKNFTGEAIFPLSFLFRTTNYKKDLKLKTIDICLLDDGKEILKRTVFIDPNKEPTRHFNISMIKELIKIKKTTNIAFKLVVTNTENKKCEIKTDYIFTVNLIKE